MVMGPMSISAAPPVQLEPNVIDFYKFLQNLYYSFLNPVVGHRDSYMSHITMNKAPLGIYKFNFKRCTFLYGPSDFKLYFPLNNVSLKGPLYCF